MDKFNNPLRKDVLNYMVDVKGYLESDFSNMTANEIITEFEVEIMDVINYANGIDIR